MKIMIKRTEKSRFEHSAAQGPTPHTSRPTQSKDSIPPGPLLRCSSCAQRTVLPKVGHGAVVPEIKDEDM